MIFPGVRIFPDVALGEPAFGFTILEPFASFIVHGTEETGAKRIENRERPPPARLHGRAFWIFVHTGARLYPDVTRDDFLRPFRRADGSRAPLWGGCPPFAAFDLRCVIGAARVIGFAPDGEDARVDADVCAIRGQVHWLLDPTVIALPRPFPWARGELGLWAPKAGDPDDRRSCERAEQARSFLELRDALRAAMADPRNHRRAVAAWHPRCP